MKYLRVFNKSVSLPFFLLLSIIFILQGCVHLVSYYDSATYKNLTDLKGEMKVFFDKSSLDGAHGKLDFDTIYGFKIKISKAYEYERGKDLNDDTIAQMNILNETVSEVLDRYMKRKWDGKDCNDEASDTAADGCLTSFYCGAKWKILETAFDIAITTERSKLEE